MSPAGTFERGRGRASVPRCFTNTKNESNPQFRFSATVTGFCCCLGLLTGMRKQISMLQGDYVTEVKSKQVCPSAKAMVLQDAATTFWVIHCYES